MIVDSINQNDNHKNIFFKIKENFFKKDKYTNDQLKTIKEDVFLKKNTQDLTKSKLSITNIKQIKFERKNQMKHLNKIALEDVSSTASLIALSKKNDRVDTLDSISSGKTKGMRALELQRQLQGAKGSKRVRLCNDIATLFEGAKSYTEMYAMRQTIEGSSSGTSPLYAMVYTDLDISTCHRVIEAINENAQKANPGEIEYRYMVYSDIDDTIKGSLNDRKTKIDGFYPSAMTFYNELAKVRIKTNTDGSEVKGKKEDEGALEAGLTFLSARPDAGKKVWNHMMKKTIDQPFHALYGTTEGFKRGTKFYATKVVGAAMPGPIKTKLEDSTDRKEEGLFQSFAAIKRQNIDRDLLLRPEIRPIMVGDTGEGDLMFLKDKNKGLNPVNFNPPLEDDRIPYHYRTERNWSDESVATKGMVGNPPNKPLTMGFAHAITSPTSYNHRPDPTNRDNYKSEYNTAIFDNYIDCALVCLENGMLDQAAVARVVDDSRNWLTKEAMEKIEDPLPEDLSPDVLYRQKLIRSVEKFDLKIEELKAKSL